MIRNSLAAGLLALIFASSLHAQTAVRPAPPPSRYGYTLKVSVESLPKGVTVRDAGNAQASRLFITNAGDSPLIIHERFQNDMLVSGTKLVSGKVYQYFPTGVPMEGKAHLKGWQAPFGDINETILYLAKEPEKIRAGLKPGLPKDVPPPEPVVIPANYNSKPYEIKATVHYHLNDAYDAFYRAQENPAEK